MSKDAPVAPAERPEAVENDPAPIAPEERPQADPKDKPAPVRETRRRR